ncbi:hypothetical protein BaRGS_00011075 [Batillaria attramentaria]|uniref:Probable arginine--tRNA ligase, mitochondrial n=1 Tax=Batillaria attramentaria TaxID=370345 RepID=A0ABD0LEB9_9CAEN
MHNDAIYLHSMPADDKNRTISFVSPETVTDNLSDTQSHRGCGKKKVVCSREPEPDVTKFHHGGVHGIVRSARSLFTRKLDMSSYFRRIIAIRVAISEIVDDLILRTLSKHGKLASAEIERLEKNVSLLVRTQDVKNKTRQGDPQYRLNVEADDLIESSVQEKNGLLVRVSSEAFYQHILQAVQKEGAGFGSSLLTNDDSAAQEKSSQTVLVEYSSPNIAKPFHAGHLRSTIIGNFIANLYEHVGRTVHRINYLGDWGTQFGLLAVGYQRHGNEELLKSDPLLHLFEVYVKINKKVEEEDKAKRGSSRTYGEGLEIFRKLEQGDPDLLQLWRRFRDLSLDEYTKMYQRLGVTFTQIQYESEYSEKTQKLLASLQERGLLKFNDQGVGYMSVMDRGNAIAAKLVKSDGSSLYLARDVAAALDRQAQFSPDRMHYVVGLLTKEYNATS